MESEKPEGAKVPCSALLGTRSPRVDGVIAETMARYPQTTPRKCAAYYEDVHQSLAPMARSLEIELGRAREEADMLRAQLERVGRWVKAFGNTYDELALQVSEALQPNKD